MESEHRSSMKMKISVCGIRVLVKFGVNEEVGARKDNPVGQYLGLRVFFLIKLIF